jgi:hypothetical protein
LLSFDDKRARAVAWVVFEHADALHGLLGREVDCLVDVTAVLDTLRSGRSRRRRSDLSRR